MKANSAARFALPFALAALAAGCVRVETPYERRTSVWVSDLNSSGFTEDDVRRALVLPAGVPAPAETLSAALSFGGASLSGEALADAHVRPVVVAVREGTVPAHRVPAAGADVFFFPSGSPAALAVEGFVAREKPWLLGNAGSGSDPASGENLLYLRGCMCDRKWASRSTWPDPHMSLFLDKLRALCAGLCGE